MTERKYPAAIDDAAKFNAPVTSERRGAAASNVKNLRNATVVALDDLREISVTRVEARATDLCECDRRVPHVLDWPRQQLAWKLALARDTRLTHAAKMVATILVDRFANRDTARCHPFTATIAEAIGTTERTVRRALAMLEVCGWIGRRKGSGRGRPSVIVFTADRAAGAILPEEDE